MADEAPVERPRGGVLTKEDIRRLCHQDPPLISPFSETELRDAAYTLHVGDNYASGGQTKPLDAGDRIEIDPHDVAIIETKEELHMPPWLIARWNVRTKRAYQGLLWVGGAQVDPAFRGKLACPIYNLSTKPRVLAPGDAIATIDFVTTTSDVLEPKQWDPPKFSGYEKFQSGVKQQMDSLKDFEARQANSTGRLERRQGEFVTLVFAIIAVLFTAVAVIATRSPTAGPFWATPLLVSAVALFFALWAAYKGEGVSGPTGWRLWVVTAVILAVIGYGFWRDLATAQQVRALTQSASELQGRVKELTTEVESLRAAMRSAPPKRKGR